jgi:ATP-dependent Clp protease ATP-binding subunit ClpA
LLNVLAAINTSAVVAELESRTRAQAREPSSCGVALPEPARRLKRLLEQAMRECHGGGASVVGVGHLLVALLHENTSISAEVLMHAGLDLASTRALIQREGSAE